MEDDRAQRVVTVTCLNPVVQEQLEAVRNVAHAYGVARLEVFGSVCTPDWDPKRSDVDFLVHYPPDYDYGPWISRHLELEAELAALLQRDVDLIMTSALRNKWFNREAAKTRMVIYDASEVTEVA